MTEVLDRRRFIGGAGAIGVAAASFAADPAKAAQAEAPQAAAAEAVDPPPAGYQFFNPDEAIFIEAFVDHLVPADALSPSGVELGIAIYADRQLAGAWGRGARMYLQGPWRKGSPNQGYQLPLTPAELVRTGIAAVDAHCRAALGAPFDRLEPARREPVVASLAEGKIDIGPTPSKPLFETLYAVVMEGLFADPIYGGNRNMAGWRLVGFPGVVAVHAEHIETFRGRRYEAEPLSISDMS